MTNIEPTVGNFITFPLKLMCSINFVWPTFDRQYRVVQYQVLTHPPPTSRQNKLAKRRHVMVCHWHISKYCVQMYDIIRLYFGGQKHVVLSEKLYGFHIKEISLRCRFFLWGKNWQELFFLGELYAILIFPAGKTNSDSFLGGQV